MAMTQLRCPACREAIPNERVIRNSAYCICGHIAAIGEPEELARDTILLRRGLVILVLAVLVSTHLINWQGHTLEVIPVKIKQYLGLANVQDLKKIVSICEDRKKWNCQIEALSQIFAHNQHDLATLAQLAALQYDHGQTVEASRNYSIYFRLGGRDESVRLAYARLLAEAGQMSEARKQFSYLISTRRDKPQFQIAREYVHFLMKTHDYPTARIIIADYRKMGPTASMFLNNEWNEINSVLKIDTGRTPATSRSSAHSIFQ